MDKELEVLLEHTGGFGSYQKWMVGFVLMPMAIIASYVNSALQFQVMVPEHWCLVPGRTKTSLSLDQWKNLTIPSENGKLSMCTQYKLLWQNESEDAFVILNETEACVHGWEHDKSEFLETVATTHGWMCDKRNYTEYIVSINTIGNAVGTLLIPVISDVFLGRRVAFYVALGLQALFTAAVVWAPSFSIHLAFRFFAGLGYQANFLLPYITVTEYLSPSKRPVIAFLTCASWVAGRSLATLVSWVLPDWRYQALSSCVPLILSFMYIFCFPESPRWLLSQGKVKECTAEFNKIAERNGMLPSERADLERKVQMLQGTDHVATSQWKVIRYPKLCLRSLLLLIIGSCVYIMHGVVNYTIRIHPNYFLNYLVLSMSELPGFVLGCLFVHYLGRRFTFIFTSFLAVIFCIIALFVFHEKWILLAIMAFIQLFSGQIIYIFYVYNTEIFPTPIRATGFSWMTVCGFTAMTASSYIMKADYGEGFPYWIIIGLSGICLLASLPLPETIGLPLPQTFQEAEDIGVGRPLLTWVHKWNYVKFMPPPSSDDLSTHDKQELKDLQESSSEENEALEDSPRSSELQES